MFKSDAHSDNILRYNIMESSPNFEFRISNFSTIFDYFTNLLKNVIQKLLKFLFNRTICAKGSIK